jgi:hypothetical protein
VYLARCPCVNVDSTAMQCDLGPLPVWQCMAKDYPLTVEVRFIPIPSDQAADKLQRLRDLLIRGAHRLVQQNGDCKQQVEPREAAQKSNFNTLQQ